MTTSEVPQWLQTVNEKRLVREKAIREFLDVHKTRFEFDIQGFDSTLGYVSRSYKPAMQDCVLVSILKQLGAIIVAKSNLPQSIMWCETDNPLWGLTVHPKDPEFTPGGSTGGEGTLLSLRGTVIGWGTDIGGSIRIPSHMNGLYGMKPSSTRTLHQECIDIMDQYYTADGGEDIRRDVEAGGEPFIPHVEALVNRGQPISVYSYWQLNKQKVAAQKRYLDLWKSTRSAATGEEIDVLLTPVMPHSAVPHRKCRWVGYTKVFNFVDYPAVVIPAGQVSKELDSEAASTMHVYQPRNPLDEWNWNLFDVKAMDGMPIGVQIVARRLHEERALGAAKAIDSILRGV
ncbi:hypothetical protein N0V86_001823 [Didymella sp. IMI 355093]|nr:hypothetical protein N0V86_001823 [Didymella sp. IMI 355093]